jgi:hypothetical protein
MENGPFIDDFPINTSIYKGFSMAMLNNQRVSAVRDFHGGFQIRFEFYKIYTNQSRLCDM